MYNQSGGNQFVWNLPALHRKGILHFKPRLRWVNVVEGLPYFVTDKGEDWTPLGQNDAVTWPDLKGILLRRDLASVESYLKMLAEHGVTCLRLMLEYCQGKNHYLERPAGRFQHNMVRLWDDLFTLCEKFGLRILLTPYDTFWMWLRWSHHPYNRKNGGPCDDRSQWLLCKETRKAIKQRLAFATERWGASGALFAWDIWNEIHPAHAADDVESFAGFIEDISSFLRQTEVRLHGRSHPQTVSVFGPILETDPLIADCTFRHSSLDFASIHFYESDTIDHPANTVDAAVSAGSLTRRSIAHIRDSRPFLDSEHGPIHSFKDKSYILPEAFDDEYFRHIQWAHFASGGAGGGMRWPNRHPHSLTPGMRKAQLALSRFLPLINWQQFRRINLNKEAIVSGNCFSVFCCGDTKQAILWLLRNNTINEKGMVTTDAESVAAEVQIPGLIAGDYLITAWDTQSSTSISSIEVRHCGGSYLKVPAHYIITDMAFAVRYIE